MIGKVSSVSGNVQSREVSISDIKSKDLESQLTSKQQRLNKISGDSKMSEQEKMKERQKIQQQIAELNRKLRMEQMKEEEKEQKIEKEQKSKVIYKEEIQKEKEKEKSEVQDEKKIEFKNASPEEVYKILNMNSEIQQERILETVERKESGIENVLESEIKMDDLHGIENTVKKEQLSEMRRKKPIQIKALGFEEETNLGINNNKRIVIKDK